MAHVYLVQVPLGSTPTHRNRVAAGDEPVAEPGATNGRVLSMMRRIVASSLKFRRLIVALAIGLIAVGVTQVGNIPVDQLPEFGPTMVEVRTEALGLSATEVEQLITVPLEQDLLNGIAFMDEIHSQSLPGLSSVVMVFEPGTALLDARQVVQEKVSEAAVALPGVSAPPQMLQKESPTSRSGDSGIDSSRSSSIRSTCVTRTSRSSRSSTRRATPCGSRL
jgi:hypothetical protein